MGDADPDRWAAALPQPFRLIDELLREVIDDMLLVASIGEATQREENVKPLPDSEKGVPLLAAPFRRSLPASLASAGADSLMGTVIEGVYAIALADGSLWLWDVGSGAEPQSLAEASGLVPCEVACTPLPAAQGLPPRQRLAFLAAKPAPEAGATPANGDAHLVVYDLNPNMVQTLEGPTWTASTVAEFDVAAFAPATGAVVRGQLPA